MKFIISIFFMIAFANANQFEQKELQLFNTTEETSTIKIGSLTLGQSGIVLHTFKNKKSIILTNAIVIKSNEQNSTIKFVKSNILAQDAIPFTNVKPSNDDIFILNHLSTTSLLISPNFEANQRISNAYYKNNFINIDIFAAWLKVNNTPLPSKEDIMTFAASNHIGTIFIQVASKLYIVDAISFKVLQTRDIKIKDKKEEVPFFSNVQNITKNVFAWFSPSKIENYKEYYTNLIGINNDSK